MPTVIITVRKPRPRVQKPAQPVRIVSAIVVAKRPAKRVRAAEPSEAACKEAAA